MPILGISAPPTPVNEPVKGYAPGSPERASIEQVLKGMSGEVIDIPNVIGGKNVETGDTRKVTNPSAHAEVLAHVHYPSEDDVLDAVAACSDAAEDWANAAWQDRAAVFLKAAELLAGPWRDTLNASTMLGQGKTVHQAEIDAACEMIDFFRFNVDFARRLYEDQPISTSTIWNQVEYRPLEGFVFAITPFNFTSIAANLPAAPALMGNTVIWKPSRTASLSNWFMMELLREAGLPDGVINLVHGDGADVGDILLPHRDLAGVHFTGSTPVFQHIWRTIGENIAGYRAYPRVVGETGGKDFIVAHPSANIESLAVAILRGSFEFQGQKCSASSRLYIPDNLWPRLKEKLQGMIAEIKMGDVRDFSNFLGPVIDERAFKKHQSYLKLAHETGEVVAGGGADGSVGWFVQPTLVRVDDPKHRLMQEEIFGPIVTAYVYPEGEFEETLDLVDSTGPYALTGAIFSQDRSAVVTARDRLRNAAGNFYVNDKPTGAVVGQQPFGGGRASGTNDKAGSIQNLTRWVSPRSIKENFVPPRDWRYPFLG